MKKYIKDTIDYYNSNSEKYYELWNEEFLNNYNFDVPAIFLSYLQPGSYILDLGCGTGRDSLYFKKNNYRVKAIDGSESMCQIASKVLNEEVEFMNFLDIDYINEFDGIFACASLLHLNNQDLVKCLKKLFAALKRNGILFASFKYGENERLKDTRFFNDMTREKFENVCKNFENVEIFKIWRNEQYGDHRSFINFLVKKI